MPTKNEKFLYSMVKQIDRPNWSLIAEEHGITVKAAQNRWFRIKAGLKEEGNGSVPKQDSESSLGKSRIKRKKRSYLSEDDDDTYRAVKEEIIIKAEWDLEKPTQGRDEVQKTSVVVKVEKDTYV